VLCHSFVKEETIGLIDGVTTVTLGDSKSYNTYKKSKFLCSDQGTTKTKVSLICFIFRCLCSAHVF